MNNNYSATNLSVRRSEKKIFENLSFSLTSGKLLKLIGPNGSGKSTLLKALIGLIEPETGDVIFDQESVLMDQEWISENICYLGHKNTLKREFTVIENLHFWTKIWGTLDQIDHSLKLMGIEYLRDTPVRYLSSGQTRRAALARSICHPGSIWLFDEPTVGLDEEGLSLLSITMKSHLDMGGIIICATHVNLGIDQKYITVLNLADFSLQSNFEKRGW
ncbi:heme ABC exporter ATP-binding protein CcmA [Emcibacteraceae bacterium]|jgi:heme exporter protein A|nr:heme ABC exporter ATP-binding protein CcmA [Kordiimonadaceae bacterium]MDA7568456.1 heme ABC exporter ATP-binding protein CcmA [Emcibacteraceae bacterium]MDA9179978.1 heme ABC exporter ATP-binding protein CcmA [Emcibacteraceae bacterium]MDA9553155.1 heme ABC exporter ATP-binding protein CcmA [Emcibacteraceae bacterium]